MNRRPPSNPTRSSGPARVVIGRPVDDAGPLAERLRALGFEPVVVPVIAVEPPPDPDVLRAALARSCRWIAVTSRHGVDALAALQSSGFSLPAPLAVVGAATGARAEEHGIEVGFRSPRATADDLGRHLPVDPGDRVVAALAELAGPDLAGRLRERSVDVEVVTAYRTVVPPVADAAARAVAEADALLVTSPSVIDRLAAVVGADALPRLLFAIGPSSAAAIRAHGREPAAVAEPPSLDGLLAALVRTLPA